MASSGGDPKDPQDLVPRKRRLQFLRATKDYLTAEVQTAAQELVNRKMNDLVYSDPKTETVTLPFIIQVKVQVRLPVDPTGRNGIDQEAAEELLRDFFDKSHTASLSPHQHQRITPVEVAPAPVEVAPAVPVDVAPENTPADTSFAPADTPADTPNTPADAPATTSSPPPVKSKKKRQEEHASVAAKLFCNHQ